MSFFQNPFPDEYRGNWLLGDRHHIPAYVLPPNLGRGKEIIYSWTQAPYNLSGNDTDGNATKYLNINYCLYNFKNWGTMQIDLTTNCVTNTAVQAQEAVAALLANSLFAERFKADYGEFNNSTQNTIRITQKKPITEFHFYVSNGQAESVLRFNGRTAWRNYRASSPDIPLLTDSPTQTRTARLFSLIPVRATWTPPSLTMR